MNQPGTPPAQGDAAFPAVDSQARALDNAAASPVSVAGDWATPGLPP
jgi:hypothetical protein